MLENVEDLGHQNPSFVLLLAHRIYLFKSNLHMLVTLNPTILSSSHIDNDPSCSAKAAINTARVSNAQAFMYIYI